MVRIYFSHTEIKTGNADKVREILLDKSLVTQTHRDQKLKFDPDVENDAYTFIGAYLGSLNPLVSSDNLSIAICDHVWVKEVITLRKDEIAKDIIDRMFKDDLNDTCGVSY
jgi:hypothetical protein